MKTQNHAAGRSRHVECICVRIASKYKDDYDHFQYEIYLVALQILRCQIARLEAYKVTYRCIRFRICSKQQFFEYTTYNKYVKINDKVMNYFR